MELDVLERKRRLGSQRSQDLEVVVRERPSTPSHGDHAVGAFARVERAERDRRDADRGSVGFAGSTVRQCDALGAEHNILEPRQGSVTARLDERFVIARSDADPSPSPLHRVDRRLQRELDQRLAIQARRESVADATDRLPEPNPSRDSSSSRRDSSLDMLLNSRSLSLIRLSMSTPIAANGTTR